MIEQRAEIGEFWFQPSVTAERSKINESRNRIKAMRTH